MKIITRRALLHGGSLAAGGFFLSALQARSASRPEVYPTYSKCHTIEPLPVRASRLTGLSHALMATHHQTHYARAVYHLNSVQQRLAGLQGQEPLHEIGYLKREELIALNSKVLHELYFGCLGGNGCFTPSLKRYLSESFGSITRWRSDFIMTAMSIKGGEGWACLAWNPYTRQLQNIWAADSRVNLCGGTPVLVADMSEHAYALDYGSNALEYLDAFLQNISWIDVEDRLGKVIS